MNFCPNCAFDIRNIQAKFCPNCGNSLQLTQEENPNISSHNEEESSSELNLSKVKLTDTQLTLTTLNDLFENYIENFIFEQYFSYYLHYRNLQDEVFEKTSEIMNNSSEIKDEKSFFQSIIDSYDSKQIEENPYYQIIKSQVNLLEQISFHEMTKELDLQDYSIMMPALGDIYNNLVLNLVSYVDGISKEEYILSEIIIEEQSKVLSHELSKIMHNFRYQSRQLIQVMQQLKVEGNQILSILEKQSKNNIANLAKNIGGGALVAVNPFIGIPLLVGNYIATSNKADDEINIFDKYDETNDNYIDLLEESHQLWVQVMENQVQYTVKTTVQPMLGEIEKILNLLEPKEGLPNLADLLEIE